MRIVLIGYGLAGRIFHAPLINAVDGLELRGVVTSDQDRGLQVRRDLPLAKVLRSSEEAWLIAKEFDLAVIATATASHLPLALKALQHGLHVVIEKPWPATAKMYLRSQRPPMPRGSKCTFFRIDGGTQISSPFKV